MPRESLCVVVPRGQAERARRLLLSKGLLTPGLRPRPLEGGIAFPVRDPHAAGLLREAGVEARPCSAVFEEYRRQPGRLEGPVRGYVVIGDFAVFSQARGTPLEAYRDAARRLLESRPGVRAVFLKMETSGEERIARLVRLAGEGPPRGMHREHGIRLLVDLERAYFNPRLAGERARVAGLARDGERVLDMFAGVGPFSLHIARAARALVVANDINPHAVEIMVENIRLNRRILRGRIVPVRADAQVLPRLLEPGFDRVIMNNPTMTPGFIPAACALARSGAVLHYYRLAGSCGEAEGELLLAASRLGCALEPQGCRRVLEHSPRRSVYVVDAVVRRGLGDRGLG